MVGAGETNSKQLLVANGAVCSTEAGGQAPNRIQPFTAQLKTTTVQVLANGATITRESTEVRAVDSQGRTFDSRTEDASFVTQPAFTWGNVNDPVENSQTNWNSQTKTAEVIKMPPESQRHGCWATDAGNMRMNYGPETPPDPAEIRRQMKAGAVAAPPVNRMPEPKVEDLGTQAIEGVEAQGHRVTTIIPAGQIGNDRDLVTVTENWVAPSLGFEVRRVEDNPQSGRSTTELTHLDLSEPPLSTFQPPEGYEVKVEELHRVPCEHQQMFGGVAAVVHGLVY